MITTAAIRNTGLMRMPSQCGTIAPSLALD
jgi:hypothetical protein